MIAIVDYRAGNLTSVARALRYLGHDCVITAAAAELRRAERLIFPGVGAAGAGMQALTELGLGDAIRAAVAAGKPFLGICLGYQVLFESSAEDQVECLGVLPGRVVRFPDNLRESPESRPLKIPHMGWNRVRFLRPHPVWAGVPDDSEFYFVHSYFPVPPPERVCATADYGLTFAAGCCRDNLVAFQFHPEKSGAPGLRLLENFCRWTPTAGSRVC